MRYLELDTLNPINYFLSHVDTSDSSRVYGRVEAYSCMSMISHFPGKFAGQDKKLYKKIKSEDDINLRQQKVAKTSLARYSSSRVLYHLIACLNQIFPDYDFRQVALDFYLS